MSTAFFYIYDLKSGREIRHTWRAPFSGPVRFSENPERGPVSYRKTANGISVQVENGKRILSVRKAGRELISASFEDSAPDVEPLRICTRAGYTGWVYVRKTGGVRLTGRIRCELGDFDIADCLGHTDYSAGFMRPETWWNWAFISGTVNQKRFALNVSCGVNETSFSENCFWLDGRLHFLPQTIFDFDANDPRKPWHVHSSALDVRFQSQGVHTERVNAGILASRFSQFYGTFEGRLQLAGNQIPIQSLYGFAEDHYAKW